jgi:4-hydroxy-tetrahydrodipicolinate synthase
MHPDRPAPLRGITPILVTSYDASERIVEDDIARQADHLVGTGVTAVGVGFGSDIVRLTDRERDALVGIVAGAVAGRLPVMAPCGANSTAAAIGRAEETLAAGATHLMITPPGAVASPTPDGIVDYYAAIAQETGAPIVVQDAPGFTGTAMGPELLARIAREVPQVCALKIEALPPAPKVGRVAALDRDGAALLGGAGGIDFWHELRRGADGTVPGAAMAELFVAIQRCHDEDAIDEGRGLFMRHLPLLALASRDGDTFFAVQLELLRRRGIVRSTRLRRPSGADPALLGELEILLADLGPASPVVARE